jgi:hypothetical protein
MFLKNEGQMYNQTISETYSISYASHYYSESKLQEKIFKSFDWSKPKLLKEELILQLKENKESTDSKLIKFITDYQKIVGDFNDILNNLSIYDSLNTLAYSADGTVYQCAKEFEQKVNSNGLRIAFSEGMIYIAENTGFIKSQILDLIDPISTEFINLYCNEIDSVCCDDAAVIISEKTLVDRIYCWGELLDKVSELK